MATIRLPATLCNHTPTLSVTDEYNALRTSLNNWPASMTSQYSQMGNLGVAYFTLSGYKTSNYFSAFTTVSSYSIEVTAYGWDTIEITDTLGVGIVTLYHSQMSPAPTGVGFETLISGVKEKVTIASSLLNSCTDFIITVRGANSDSTVSVFGTDVLVDFTVDSESTSSESATLTASRYAVQAISSNTTYEITNETNLFEDTTNGHYAALKVTTTTAYAKVKFCLHLLDFEFPDLPENAIVTGVSAKLRACHYNGAAVSMAFSNLLPGATSTNTTVYGIFADDRGLALNRFSSTIPAAASGVVADPIGFNSYSSGSSGVYPDSGTMMSYGSVDMDIYMQANSGASSSGSTAYLYVYGADITVSYSLPNIPATVNSTKKTGSGTISPSGSTSMYVGQDYTLTITPTDTSDEVRVIKDKMEDVSSDLTPHYEQHTFALPNTFTFTDSSDGKLANYSYISNSGTRGYDTTDTASDSEMAYCNSQSNQAKFIYSLNCPIGYGVRITKATFKVKAQVENHTQSTERMYVRPYIEPMTSGEIVYADGYDFKNDQVSGTTAVVHEWEITDLPDIGQTWEIGLVCTVGYYGGAVAGFTVILDYEDTSGVAEYYTYTFDIEGDTTLDVYIADSFTTTNVFGSLVLGSPAGVEPSEVITNQTDGLVTFLGAELMLMIVPYSNGDKLRLFEKMDTSAANDVNRTSQLVKHENESGAHASLYYTYTFTANGNYLGQYNVFSIYDLAAEEFYFKNGGTWVKAIEVYKKVNGAWVLQNDLFSVHWNHPLSIERKS